MRRSKPNQTAFDIVNDMEADVQALVDYGHVVARRLAETLSREEAGHVRADWMAHH